VTPPWALINRGKKYTASLYRKKKGAYHSRNSPRKKVTTPGNRNGKTPEVRLKKGKNPKSGKIRG